MSNRSDDFNRADSSSSLGTPSDGGGAWTALVGTWGIASNTGYLATDAGDSQDVAVLDSGTSDVDVQVTLATLTSTPGLILRAADSNNYLLLQTTTSGFTMYRRASGSFTGIGSWSGTTASGDVIKFQGNGTTVKAFHAGVERISVTESSGQTNTKHGIYSFVSTGPRFDDFSITDLGGGGGGGVFSPNFYLEHVARSAA